MLMKLSKRIAAALVAMCMLLTVMPAFAATIDGGPLGTFPNDSIDGFPAEGKEITAGPANLAGNASASLLTIIFPAADLGNIPGLTTAKIDALKASGKLVEGTDKSVSGTDFEGIWLSGKVSIPGDSLNYSAGTSNLDTILKNKELIEFEFENLYLETVRPTGDYRLILGANVANWVKAIVSAKKVKSSIDFNAEAKTATREDLVDLTAAEIADLTGGTSSNGTIDFNMNNQGAYRMYNLRAERAYGTVDTGVFPDGTIFLSANAMGNTYGESAGLRHTGRNDIYMSGMFVSQADETYTVFGLRALHGGTVSLIPHRGAAAKINGTSFVFNGYTSIPAGVTNDWSWAWDEASGTISLTNGGLFKVEQYKNGDYNQLAAIALVPTSAVAGMNQTAGWQYAAANIPSQTNLDAMYRATATVYVPPAPVEATISVNGTEYDVTSVDAETVVSTVADSDFDNQPVEGVTILDALVTAGVITTANKDTYKNNLVVKLNGLTICDAYDKWIVTEDDAITYEILATINATNFAPVNFGAIKSNIGAPPEDEDGNANGLKMIFDKTTAKATQLAFALSGDDYVDGALIGAKLRGEGTYTGSVLDEANETTYPAGTKYYFDQSTFDDTVKSGTYGVRVTGIEMGNDKFSISATLPNGTLVHHPYAMARFTSKDVAAKWDLYNVWAVNSNTTDTVKARFVNGKFQLYTDGSKAVTIVKIKDGNVTLVDAYVSVGVPYSFELEDGEKAYVWARNHYVDVTTAGTTMKPLTGVLENPAE